MYSAFEERCEFQVPTSPSPYYCDKIVDDKCMCYFLFVYVK